MRYEYAKKPKFKLIERKEMYLQSLVTGLLSFIAPYRKAVVGAISTVVLAWLVKHGVDSSMSVGNAVQLGSAAVVNGGLVWLTKNGK